MQRQTITPPRRFRRQHTRINDTTHRVEEILGNTRAVTLDSITLAQALRGKDVALSSSSDLGDEGNVTTTARIALDAVDDMRTGGFAEKVESADTTLVTASTVTDGDATGVVTTSDTLAFAGNGEGLEGTSFPEVLADGAEEMTETGGARLVFTPGGGGLV